jgi:RNA polymerase sigma factor (sigma-70 family)
MTPRREGRFSPKERERRRMLADRLRRGMNEDVSAVVEEFAKRLYGFARALIKTRDEIDVTAEDLVNTTFLKACTKGHTLRGDDPLPWLWAVLRNHAIDTFRARKRLISADGIRRRADGADDTWSVVEVALAKKAGATSGTEEIALRAAETTALREAIARLPRKMRGVIRLHIYEHKTVAEVSAEMGISEQTVLNHLSAVRAKLRRAMRSWRSTAT